MFSTCKGTAFHAIYQLFCGTNTKKVPKFFSVSKTICIGTIWGQGYNTLVKDQSPCPVDHSNLYNAIVVSRKCIYLLKERNLTLFLLNTNNTCVFFLLFFVLIS